MKGEKKTAVGCVRAPCEQNVRPQTKDEPLTGGLSALTVDSGDLFGLPRRTHGYRTGRRKSSSAINGSAGEPDAARPTAAALALARPAPEPKPAPGLANGTAKATAKATALSGDEADSDGADGADDDAAAALD